MSFLESIILGIIQGVTEFLPVSSSGHLLMARTFFNINEFDLFLEIFLHAGTLLSIILFWHKEIIFELKKILNWDLKYSSRLFLATLPAGLVGLLFKNTIESVFYSVNSSHYLIITYFVMGLILLSIKNKNNNESYLTYKIAILIGLAQAVAILPGISRSGITICIGCLCGLSLNRSTQFSFFLAIPIMFFASIESIYANSNLFYNNKVILPLISGFLVSLIIGYIVINLLVKIIYNRKFWVFSIYCFCISIILLFYNYVN